MTRRLKPPRGAAPRLQLLGGVSRSCVRKDTAMGAPTTQMQPRRKPPQAADHMAGLMPSSPNFLSSKFLRNMSRSFVAATS